ncbi:sensor histidine kinase [Clostridiaceae bacterium]|nr:sensor histidine kinase [Clostridiaceae bacterium]
MRLKDRSLLIQKNIAVLLHMIFLVLAVSGISFIYLNTESGSGISWLRDRKYEDSPQFMEQFQQDLNQLFQYISYRDAFENDGILDLSSQMFSVERGDGPEILYTLEEVLRYARSQGFYLNTNFDVVNDLLVYDNAATAKDYRINWRAYTTEEQLSGPGDAYTSLLELSREVLDCLSIYYKVHYQMIDNPSNFYFHIVYEDNHEDPENQMIYSNASHLSQEDLVKMGRYYYLDSNSIFVRTNLSDIPVNVTTSMEKNNHSDADYYSIMVAVDTSYSAEDIYAEQAKTYLHLRGRILEGLLALIIGIIGCIVTLYYLVLVSGYKTKESTVPTLHGFDTINTECFILLAIIFTLFSLFLGEKIGYRIIHLLTSKSTWEYAERMMTAVIIYICFIAASFSLLRRYKCQQLWANSLIRHIYQTIDLYFVHRTFSYRLACLFFIFVAAQVMGTGFILLALRRLQYPIARLAAPVFIFALLTIDYLTFQKLFLSSLQEDKIAEAISRIAGGDTSYQMEFDGLSGKELEIARRINQIGVGLERALQEQVKSERLKADLITNVSHDIKTPLTSIINYVDLMKREHIPNEKVQEYLSILDQKSQRLKNLTEDLLEASKASSGAVKLEMVRLDLVEMIWQTNGEFEEKFSERNLELVPELPDQNIVIEADGRHLWRVLENLYNNAFKYAMERSRVFTTVTCENGYAYFTIKNVSEHPLNVSSEDLTERFVRGDVSRTTEGSGLGLSIAQSLTKLQGGTFEILVDGDLYKARIGFVIADYPNPV